MIAEEFVVLRKSLGFTQTELAGKLGMSLRGIQKIENGEAEVRVIHVLAIERVAMSVAAERNAPMLAPPSIRKEAIKISEALFA